MGLAMGVGWVRKRGQSRCGRKAGAEKNGCHPLLSFISSSLSHLASKRVSREPSASPGHPPREGRPWLLNCICRGKGGCSHEPGSCGAPEASTQALCILPEVHVLSEPQNGALLGNRILAVVIRLRWRSYRMRAGPKFNNRCLYKENEIWR